jgi:hypothetical protein
VLLQTRDRKASGEIHCSHAVSITPQTLLPVCNKRIQRDAEITQYSYIWIHHYKITGFFPQRSSGIRTPVGNSNMSFFLENFWNDS